MIMPFVVNDGIRINYEIINECNGEYLLLHTGLNSTKEAWIELSYTEELKKHFKLILIDPRGHGESDKPRDLKKYSFKLMAGDVVVLLDHLKINKVHFFGYSLGAFAAQFGTGLAGFCGGIGMTTKFPACLDKFGKCFARLKNQYLSVVFGPQSKAEAS